MLVVGHRRFEAYRRLAEKEPERFGTIPAVVADGLKSDEITEIQLVENIQRENLSALEVRQTLLHFRSRGYSQKAIAEKLSMSQGYIKNLFSAIRSIDDDSEITALVEESERITLSDIQEVMGLGKSHQIILLRMRAKGEIKSLNELRDKVKEFREKGMLASSFKSAQKKDLKSCHQFFRLSGDELSFLPAKVNLATMASGQKAELRELLRAALAKLGE